MVEKKCIVASCSKVAAHALNSHAPMAYCQDHYKEYTGAKKASPASTSSTSSSAKVCKYANATSPSTPSEGKPDFFQRCASPPEEIDCPAPNPPEGLQQLSRSLTGYSHGN
eukprot:Rmarinus@m.23552